MADNTIQTGADTIRDKDRAGVKTQIFGRDLNIGGTTEVLETAVALADGVATPTVPGYAAYGYAHNGATWDRARMSTNGELYVSAKDMAPAAQNITAQDIASTTAAGANGQTIISGTPTAGSAASAAITGDSSFAVQVSGTWTGTLQFERSLDAGATFTSIGAFAAGTAFIVQTVTANGNFHGNASSATTIRVRATAAITGTAVIRILAGAGTGTITVGNPLRLFDKVSGVEHTIKAGSTLSAVTDTATVVTVRDAVAVTGTFFQTTQPVSVTSLPLPTGAAQDGTDITTPTAMPTGGVGIRGWLSAIWTKLNGSLAVTGTFFQATQPVSAASLPLPAGASTETTLAALNTKVPAQGQALAAASTPVVLTAAQVTTLTPPAAITGFNLETTQALVKAKTDNLDVALSTRAADGTDGTTPPAVLGGGTGIRGWLRSIYEKLTGTLAVTGTFYQATQPVSGTFYQATQPVSIATMPSTPVTGTFFQATQPTSMATNTPDVTDRAGRLLGTVQQATLTKGTQGATGVSTQDLKDAGRVNVAITCYQAAGIITTEALFAAGAFSSSRDGAAATTGQQFTVTTGKRFVIQSIVVSIKNTAAAAGTSKLALRYNGAGGVIANTSPVLAIMDLGTNSTVAAAYVGPTEMAFPDGVELLSASTFGFTNLSSAATMLHTITINGFEY